MMRSAFAWAFIIPVAMFLYAVETTERALSYLRILLDFILARLAWALIQRGRNYANPIH